jgi:hypothetical protein|uniref:Uncharacterized protein n=1 Tax=Oryza sativa subsp. japonica TaxID=39947 RepID=Q6K5Z5_ORYSJ|nr:hypothetical protein [Oryza sativa Japonica Group]BAD19711.1 hypothetical protein [Oryza sativa Japonica Group]
MPDPKRSSPDLVCPLSVGSVPTSLSPCKPSTPDLNDDHNNSVHDDTEGAKTCRKLEGVGAHAKMERRNDGGSWRKSGGGGAWSGN